MTNKAVFTRFAVFLVLGYIIYHLGIKNAAGAKFNKNNYENGM